MWEQIQSNRRKTAVLVLSMAALLFVLGYVIAEAYVPGAGIMGLAVAAGVWALLTLIAFAQGDRIVLALSGAREIEKQDHPELFNVVEEMTIASGLGKMPRVYLVPDDALNAFAVGRNKDKAAVAVTAGLLGRLDRDELQGVVGHEIGHIVNRDVLLMTMLSVLLGTIVMTSEIFLRSLRFGAGRGARYSGRGRGGKGGGQGAAIIMVLALVLALLAPILAQLIYFAVSRRREYLADASSAVFTRYPEGLASALEKLAGAGIPVERASKATAAMYIVNPFAKAGLSAYTSTHPPAASRIKVLRSLGGTATFSSYQQAWKNQLKKKRGPLPASALHDTAHGGAVRAASALAGAARKDPREQARQVGDLLRGLNQFVFLPCACGLKLKLPPNYPRDSIECPRCHRELRVPVAELAAAQVAAEQLSGELERVTGIPMATPRTAPPEIPAASQGQIMRRKPGEWMTFQCACGRMQTLSPAVIATRVKCPSCSRETRLIE